MLSEKMTQLVETIKLYEEPWIPSLPSAPTVRGLDLNNPQGRQHRWFSCSAWGNIRAKNSKVAHGHMEHKEHNKFILVWASGE
jgi:hypothetical protein